MGQRSTYHPALGEELCERISAGDTLRNACREMGLNHSTVLTWARDIPEFANLYARAREDGDDVEFEKLQETTAEAPPRIPASGAVDPGWVAWKRLQVDTMKWALAKRRPRKYGERQTIEHEVGESLAARMRKREPLA